MDVCDFPIRGPLMFKSSRFNDERGFVSETYNARQLESYIGSVRFVQDNRTFSKAAGTVRGLHFQIPPVAQGKLVSVVRGAIFDVAVDIRGGSPTFGHYIGVELTAEAGVQFWIPPGFAHGFCTLESQTEVIYKLTDYFSPDHDRGLAWDDPTVGVEWPVCPWNVILSARDRNQSRLAELPLLFTWT